MKRSWALRATIACGLACLLGVVGQATGATFVVTTTADADNGACVPALCTLRDAVIAANATAPGPNVITLPAGTYNLTIPGTGENTAHTGDLDITRSVTINGAGVATTLIDAGQIDRVFDVRTGTVIFNGIKIQGGRAPVGEDGGGIRSNGTLTLNNCMVTNNQTLTGDGAGIWTSGTLTLNTTSVIVNVAGGGGNGGGIYNGNVLATNASEISLNTAGASGGNGGGIYNESNATITDTRINLNQDAGGGNGGGIYHGGGVLTINRAEISQNTTEGTGGGIYSNGIGVTVTNVTIGANTASTGAGVSNNGNGFDFVDATISHNNGGGLRNTGVNFTLKNTIVANQNSGSNCAGAIGDSGTNMQFPGTTCGATITSADPLLDPTLSANSAPPILPGGGVLRTYALLSGSPAINAGTTGCPPTPSTDQRSLPRPSGPACDIGAFEVQVAALPTLSINNVTQNEGNSGTTPFVFTVTLSAASASTVTVNFATADGTANAGSDYVATSGTLTFNPAVTTQTITVNVNGDTTVEPNETFFVNLSSPTNATIAVGQGTGTIVNDDVAPLPTLSINNVTQNEGNSGTTPFVFTVTLSAASASTVTVNYATADGTATSPSDYIATSGTLTFAPGVTTQTVTVSVVGDTTPEANETFTVNLSSPANATIAAGTGTGTIVNDDAVVTSPSLPVPALGEWALLALAALLLASALFRLRRLGLNGRGKAGY